MVHVVEQVRDVEVEDATRVDVALQDETDLEHVAAAYRTMDERRAIKSLLRIAPATQVA